MESKDVRNHKQVVNQLFIYKITGVLVGLIVWAYYYILLYKKTGSIQVLLLDFLIFMLAQFLGFLIFSFFVDKIGYLKSFRVSSIAHALTLGLILLFLNRLPELYVIFAVLRGISIGVYWPIDHSIYLKDLHGSERGKILSLIQSFILLLKIIIPALAGALISYSGNYNYTFVLGIALCVGSVFIPFSYNKKTRSKITSKEIVRILNMQNIGLYSLISIFKGAINSMIIILFMIIPYILIGEEFGVGTLYSFVGFLAAIIAWINSNSSFNVRLRLGYLGASINAVFTLFLSIVWTIPALVIRSFAMAFTQSVSVPIKDELDYRIKEKILKEFQNESAIEMNIIVETFYLIGRIIAIAFLIIIFTISSEHDNLNYVDNTLRLIIAVTGVLQLVSFISFVFLNKKIKIR